MTMNKNYWISIFVSFCVIVSVPAQKNWTYELFVGYDIGATLPIPLPAEVRELGSWNPGFSGTLFFQATHWLDSDWGISTGLALERKGMKADAQVKHWQTSLEVGEEGRFSGTFSGKNTATFGGTYLVMPLCAAYRNGGEQWIFRCGGYVAVLLRAVFQGTASGGYIRNGGPTGERINVDYATFDFSDKIRKCDLGIVASINRRLSSRLSAQGQLLWGLLSVLPDSFEGIPYKMYNVYSAFGLSYAL
ncbi:MAG: PorT family protein [Tannerellaceae bacterium]|jgi:hypothetical protein|nr:PorT family protein [Tannerellaceae bacterium]